MFKRWWNNQWERYYELKGKEDIKRTTKCPECKTTKIEKHTNYSWIVFFIGLILILINVFITWNNFTFILGLILAGYQSMKMLGSEVTGDKHICTDCGHEWIGKGQGIKHRVVG